MKILLATDGSPHAQNATKLLRRLSCCEPIELTVLTVTYQPAHAEHEEGDEWVQSYVNKEKAYADEAFAQVETILEDADVTLQQVIEHGHVGHATTELATSIGAELIVIGAKGHSQLDRILLGSTSDFVATQADCSVLVVRPTDLDGDCGDTLRITIGFDGSAGSRCAIEQFLAFDCGALAKAQVVTVIRPVRTLARELFPNSRGGMEQRMEEAQHNLEEVAATFADAGMTANQTIIQSDHVGSALCEIADRHQSDLIIVGDTGRSELSKLVLGSVPNYVLRHSSSSVLICRSRQLLAD